MFDIDDELLIRVADVLIVITFITVGGVRDSLGLPLWPPLVASGGPLCNLVSCFGQCLRPPPGATLPVLYTKMAPTASSPEACLVAISRSSFVVLGWSRPSSCTRVWQFMPEQNAKLISTLQIMGSS
jgi:hypothetical protein